MRRIELERASLMTRWSERIRGGTHAYLRGRRRGSAPGGALAVLLGLLLLVPAAAGCSSGSGDTTATTVATSTRTSTSTIIVGDKTKEAYQAEIAGLETQAKATPTDLTVLQELAIAYYNVDRFTDAVTVYEQMLKIKEDPTTRNNYGNMLRDAGRVEDAKAAYNQALQEDPKLTVAYVNLASLLFLEGQKDEAYKVLDDGMTKLDGTDKTRLQTIKDTFQKQ
jgi:tetratricopeptide (TPR) repeat protein